MASTYTTNLRLTKQADGENPNSWGQILNDGVISLADQAIAGLATITMVSASTAVTLTGNDGASDQSRNAFLKISGSAANAHQLIIPANSKSYSVLNTATGAGVVLMKTVAGAGVTIQRNSTKFQHVVCDGASVRSANLLNNNVTITDNLVVGNFAHIGGTCTIVGAAQLNSAVCISGAANFSSTVTVVGAAVFKSNVSIGGTLTGVETNPSGAVTAFAGTSLPNGWLWCYGQSLERAGTYADLFSAIGTTYGSADSSHFNVPDLRGRAVAGQDDMGGTSANRLTGLTGGVNGDTLGAGGGIEAVSITEANLAAHAHLIAADAEAGQAYPTASNHIAKKGDWGSNNNYQFSGTDTDPTLGLTTSVGSGTAHNNVQPTFILNYIIKT